MFVYKQNDKPGVKIKYRLEHSTVKGKEANWHLGDHFLEISVDYVTVYLFYIPLCCFRGAIFYQMYY